MFLFLPDFLQSDQQPKLWLAVFSVDLLAFDIERMLPDNPVTPPNQGPGHGWRPRKRVNLHLLLLLFPLTRFGSSSVCHAG